MIGWVDARVSDRFFYVPELLLRPREPGCGETLVSLVSAEPGCHRLFASREPGPSIGPGNQSRASRMKGPGCTASGQPIRPQTNHALTQSFGSTHRVELLVRTHRVDPSSSLVSIQSKELRSSTSHGLQRNASFLFGWYSMIDVGWRISVSAMVYRMTTPMPCAISGWKL